MTNKTMTTMIRRFTAGMLLALLTVTISGQVDDFGVWFGASASKGLTNKIDLQMSGMIRTFRNGSKVEQGFIEAGAKYKITSFLDASASYRLTGSLEDNGRYYAQHKFFADLSGDVKVSNFTFSGRLRFQTRIKTYLVYYVDKFPDYTGRIKFKVMYRTPSFPMNPYFYYEVFCPMFANTDRLVGKNRISLGVQYKMSKKNSVEIGYIHQRDFLPDISDINIISMTYSLNL